MAVCTSNIGFCPYLGHTNSVIQTWDGDTVVSVECAGPGADHKTCGYADVCKLYQQRPVGFKSHVSNEELT